MLRLPKIELSNLTAKLFLAGLAGTVLTSVIIGFSTFVFTRSLFQEAIASYQLDAARQGMDRIDRMLYERAKERPSSPDERSLPAVIRILKEISVPAFLIDREGSVIADNSGLAGKKEPGAYQPFLQVPSTSMVVPRGKWLLPEETLLSVAVQQGYSSYKGNGWRLVLSNPTRIAFSRAYQWALRPILLLIPLILFMGVGVLLIMVNIVVRPIERLIAVTREITAGNFEKKASIESKDEIGQLAFSFNQMTAKLHEFYGSLEDKVKQRTEQYISVNHKLKAEIEERIDLEKKLRENEQRSRLTIETANDAFVGMDVQGAITDWNLMAEKIFGWSREEALGKKVSELIIPDTYRAAHKEGMERFFKTGETSVLNRRLEMTALHKDKHEFPIELTAWCVRTEGSTSFSAFIHDVTQRRKLQTIALQADKMAALGQLSGGIAHDLNNGLTPIIGYVDFLLSETTLEASTRDLLTEAKRSAHRCAEVVEKLLSFSRPSTQDKSPVRLEKVLEEYRGMLHSMLPRTIEVRIQCPPDIGGIFGNETELMTVLVNLAINSRDAMSEKGGLFNVEAKNFHLDEMSVKQGFSAGEYVVISVSDEGSGMTPEVMHKIFEPFFTTKAKGRGTGLGLSMAFNIIKDHKGWIDVSSRVMKGTTFQIYLPVDAKEGSTKKERAATDFSDLPRGKETLLFVDDEETMRKLGKVFLGHLGYTVVFASDGEEALKVYQEMAGQIAAVVLDMTMPKLTGRETIRRFLQLNPAIKIIAQSGYTSEGNVKEILEDGAKAFLAKPYAIDGVAKLLRKVLDS